MLTRAAARVRRGDLRHVSGLMEVDAEATGLPDSSFDIAVAMFVATVVPDARRLLTEMKRVIRPGGHILFVNHFRASGGFRRLLEDGLAPASRALGWHPDFALEDLLGDADRARVRSTAIPPLGLFTLVELINHKD